MHLRNKKSTWAIPLAGALFFSVACAPAANQADQESQELAQILALADPAAAESAAASGATNYIMAPVEPEGPSGGGGGGGSSSPSSWGPWSMYQSVYNLVKGTYVSSNGNCGGLLSLCTKGNYNYAFKESRCRNSGKNPAWYRGRVKYKGNEWDKEGTNQDHGGVCVTEHPTDGVPMFHDGCTGYPGGAPGKYNKGPLKGWNPGNWGEVFHGACVMHDHCYKAEPGYSGKSKFYCDNIAMTYMIDICNRSYKNQPWLGPLNKHWLCVQNATSEARLGTLIGSKSHYTAFDNEYEDGYDWSRSAICPGSASYDVVTGKCQ